MAVSLFTTTSFRLNKDIKADGGKAVRLFYGGSMDNAVKIKCRKCLLEDMDENDFLRDMRSHIAAYPADKRVSEEEYRRRLAFCKGCDKLVDGMCVLCGCYVELRALKIGMRCADINKKW